MRDYTKIMVVDDSKSDIFLIKNLIQNYFKHTRVISDNNIFSCFFKLTCERPDILIIDWNFGFCSIEDEPEIFNKICRAKIPVLIYSATDATEIRRCITEKYGMLPGNLHVITKGNVSEFLQAIEDSTPRFEVMI